MKESVELKFLIRPFEANMLTCLTWLLHIGQDKGRPLPKFGEWDVNNPASAEGFTVIFNKARDEKKTNTAVNNVTPRRNDPAVQNEPEYPRKAQRCNEKQWEMASYNKSEDYQQLSLEIPAVMHKHTKL
ncbi:protein NOI4 [Trifolium repens]|nr:protein NOI4 [Trifolium repens]